MTSLGREETESNCSANFPRTISQTSSLFRQSQHKQIISDSLEARTKSIVDRCSDMTCTTQYALTEGPKRGGGVGELMWATHSAPPPPSHFMFATGLVVDILVWNNLSSTLGDLSLLSLLNFKYKSSNFYIAILQAEGPLRYWSWFYVLLSRGNHFLL